MRKILIFGDSHSIFYKTSHLEPNNILQENSILGYEVERIGFDGGSVRGVGRRKFSTLNVADKILDHVSSEDIVVLIFGQVDMELGFYFRQYVKQVDETVDVFIFDCIESYRVLIEQIKEKTNFIIIKGINMPVIAHRWSAIKYTKRVVTENISDQDEIEKTFNNLKKNFPDILKRIQMAKDFNLALEKMCLDLKIEYFDINKETCYPNGFVREEFVSIFPDIHLLKSLRVLQIHFDCLKNIIKNKLIR